MIKGRICNSCKSEIQRSELDNNYSICPHCGYYMRMHARKRISSLGDKKSFREWDANMKFSNPLNDREYAEKSNKASLKHKLNDAIITGEMDIEGFCVAIGVMDTRYMMASMGYVVGEKITRLFEKATKKRLPVIMFCCSGGARMQEGIISLMQMEKTAAAVRLHSEAGLLYISVLTNPTMGGVAASFAALADIILAEKNAMIGFAGQRVIEQNTGEKLPSGFQTAEFQKEKGFVDVVLERQQIRDYLACLLRLHCSKVKYRFGTYEQKMDNDIMNYEVSSIWKKVQLARSKDRPTSMDYISKLFTNFVELSGDRATGDDPAIVAGLAEFNGCPVTIVGQQKGKKTMQEAIFRNWGMPSPSGYRKALRLIKQAEKFHRPVVCLVDTIGAACDKKAEECGQGWAIAKLLDELSAIKTPILSIIISEGGSGGALALAVGNEVWILENAVYSILTPEGYASILWKDNSKAPEAAKLMKMEAGDLLRLGIVDKIISETKPVTIENMDDICKELENQIRAFLEKYEKVRPEKIAKKRYQRFRKY